MAKLKTSNSATEKDLITRNTSSAVNKYRPQIAQPIMEEETYPQAQRTTRGNEPLNSERQSHQINV